MAVPRKKTSRSKRGLRQSHYKARTETYVEDKSSGEMRRPHHIDPSTGEYRGRQILDPK